MFGSFEIGVFLFGLCLKLFINAFVFGLLEFKRNSNQIPTKYQPNKSFIVLKDKILI